MASPIVPPLSPVLLAGFALGPIPARLLEAVLNAAMGVLVRRHGEVLRRLAPYSGALVLIDPVDLPFRLAFRLDPEAPTLTIADDETAEAAVARISGPLAVLIDLVEGRLDGDALFFSRDIHLEGNSEPIVALRNAVDGEEIDLRSDLLSVIGPFAEPAERALDAAAGLAARAARDLETMRSAIIAPVLGRCGAQESHLQKLEREIAALRRDRDRRLGAKRQGPAQAAAARAE